MNLAEQYIQDVLNGDIVVGESIHQACQKHITDLSRQNDEDFPFYFDADAGQRAIDFVSLQKHAKGKLRGKPFTLQGWQAVPLWCVFGWKRKDDDLRRYRTLYVKVARKNGKTEYAAAIGNYGFIADGEMDPEVYWVATKKDQARIGWKRQKLMIELLQADSPALASYCKTAAHRVSTKEGDGFVSYLGKDSNTEDGHNPYYGLIDEWHAHKNNDMVDVITSGMMSRDQPLLVIITTAGFNPVGPCAQFEAKAKQSLRGQLDLSSTFAWIHDLDDDDDWEDESNWAKANPNLGVSVHLHNLRAAYKKAKDLGATYEVNFKTKNLNVWTKSHSTWISDEIWVANGEDVDVNTLRGRVCYGGLDLASVRDLCSLCLFFPAPPNTDEKHIALWWHWVNEETANMREKNDGVPYLQWSKDGHITLTPGNVTDHDYIQNHLERLMGEYAIEVIGYDRKMSIHLIPNLVDKGLEMDPFGQGFLSMSAPTKEVERLVHGQRLNHLNNPLVRWQMSNVSIQTDPAENIKVDKGRSVDKVDGVVSLVMAVGEWMTYRDESHKSVYDDRDLYIL